MPRGQSRVSRGGGEWGWPARADLSLLVRQPAGWGGRSYADNQRHDYTAGDEHCHQVPPAAVGVAFFAIVGVAAVAVAIVAVVACGKDWLCVSDRGLQGVCVAESS
jgi:hypothetical protein